MEMYDWESIRDIYQHVLLGGHREESLPDGERLDLPMPPPPKALCGPGDHAEPVITIMLPEED